MATILPVGGKNYEMQTQYLNVGETAIVDIKHLRDAGIPDRNGVRLPKNTTSGQFDWSTAMGDGSQRLMGRNEVESPSRGVASSFSCASCNCPYDTNQIDMNPYDPFVAIGLGAPVDTQSHQYNLCNGAQRWGSYYASNWAINTAGFFTMASGMPSNMNGVSGGSSGFSTKLQGVIHHFSGNVCSVQSTPTLQSTGTGNTVTITQDQNLWFFGNGITAPSGFALGGTAATLTANNTGSGTFAWSVTNGSSKVSLSASSTNAVTITSTSYSTAPSDVTVQLIYTPTGRSALTFTKQLSVDSPYKLVAGTPSDQGVAASSTCANPTTGTSGYLSILPYTVMSMLGVAVMNVAVNETFANLVDDYIGNNWPPYAVKAGNANYLGQVADGICMIHPEYTPPSRSPNNGSVKIDHGNQGLFAGSLTEADGLQVQSDILQRYQDHGRHLSIVSPVR